LLGRAFRSYSGRTFTRPPMSDPTNPYAALSLIVAPAVLTKASSVLVLSTMRFFYASIGAFAAAALTSLIGAALLGTPLRTLPVVLEVAALMAGFIGVGLALGCVLLLRETRIAVRTVTEEAAHLREHFGSRTKSS
jgi:hypothetical protein